MYVAFGVNDFVTSPRNAVQFKMALFRASLKPYFIKAIRECDRTCFYVQSCDVSFQSSRTKVRNLQAEAFGGCHQLLLRSLSNLELVKVVRQCKKLNYA